MHHRWSSNCNNEPFYTLYGRVNHKYIAFEEKIWRNRIRRRRKKQWFHAFFYCTKNFKQSTQRPVGMGAQPPAYRIDNKKHLNLSRCHAAKGTHTNRPATNSPIASHVCACQQQLDQAFKHNCRSADKPTIFRVTEKFLLRIQAEIIINEKFFASNTTTNYILFNCKLFLITVVLLNCFNQLFTLLILDSSK